MSTTDTNTKGITALDVAKRAIELADAAPDFIYVTEEGRQTSPTTPEGCMYVHDRDTESPTGGCLFGRALLGLGFEPEQLSEGVAVDGLLRGLGIPDVEYTQRGQVGWLSFSIGAAQRRQDQGETWGEAVSDLRTRVASAEATGVVA